MSFFERIMSDASGFEIEEDEKVIQNRDPVSTGDMKDVFDGLRPVMVKKQDHDDELVRIHDDLHGSARVVNTWIYSKNDVDIIKQDLAPESYFEAVMEEGLDEVVRQAVEIEESFLENGYVYRDLKPDNIRFHNGYGMAVDYLDRLAVQREEDVDDMETALAKSYDLFVQELSDHLYGVEEKEVEKLVDDHSNYTEAIEFTGSPYIDFRLKYGEE
jgi:hypothetical protein